MKAVNLLNYALGVNCPLYQLQNFKRKPFQVYEMLHAERLG